MRHLANVFQGLLMSSPDQFNSPSKWGKLWLHESERVYADRLVGRSAEPLAAGHLLAPLLPLCLRATAAACSSSKPWLQALSPLCAQVSAGDLDNYNKLAVGIAKKYFALPDIDDYYKKKDARPLIFCHFARGLGERCGAAAAAAQPECHSLASFRTSARLRLRLTPSAKGCSRH